MRPIKLCLLAMSGTASPNPVMVGEIGTRFCRVATTRPLPYLPPMPRMRPSLSVEAPQAASGWWASARWLRRGKKRLDAPIYGRIRWFVGGHLGGGAVLCLCWWLLTAARDVGSYLLIFLFSLPLLVVSLLVAVVILSLASGVLFGAAKGLWRTFAR